jgi:hypothetical protein
VIADLEQQKYSATFTLTNPCFALSPRRAFAISGDDFTGSPTRWKFDHPA